MVVKDTGNFHVLVDHDYIGVVTGQGLGNDLLQVKAATIENRGVGDDLFQLLGELVGSLKQEAMTLEINREVKSRSSSCSVEILHINTVPKNAKYKVLAAPITCLLLIHIQVHTIIIKAIVEISNN